MSDNFGYSYVLCLRILYYARLIYVKYPNKSDCNHNRVDKSERLNKRQLTKSNIMVSVNITMSYTKQGTELSPLTTINTWYCRFLCHGTRKWQLRKGFMLPSYYITNNRPPRIFPAFWLVSKGASSMSDATFVLLTVVVWWCDLI